MKLKLPSWALCAVVFVCFATLYAATAQRGVSWQDSGEFQYRVLAGDYRWHSGIARAHPLYIAMARGFSGAFPDSLKLYAVTAFSGLGSAVALALLAAVVVRLTGSARAASAAVVALGLSHMAWWLAAVAEVYTWSLAALMLELYCLARLSERGEGRWLLALFAANGLHAGLHNFAFVSLPLYAYAALAAVRASGGWRATALLAAAGCVWLAGASPLLAQAAALLQQGTGLPATARSLFFGLGYERAVLGVCASDWRLVAANFALAGVSLLNPVWALAAKGWRGAEAHAVFRRYLAGLTLLHAVFWARYFVPDQATFVLPTLGLLAAWVGLGCRALENEAPQRGKRLGALVALSALCAVAVPCALFSALKLAGFELSRSRALPFRDEAGYWLKPWKHGERSAAAFVDAVGRQLRPGDVLIADTTAAGALLAAREAGLLRGLRLVTPWSGETDAELRKLARGAGARAFIVSPVPGYAPGAVLESGPASFVREGVLYRIAPQNGAAAAER